MHFDGDVPSAGRGFQVLDAPLREAADVARDVHRPRAGRFGDREHFPDPVAAAEDEVAAARGERAVEVVQRLEQEPESVGRAVWGVEHGVVEDEQGNDVVRSPNGGGEHRIVTQA